MACKRFAAALLALAATLGIAPEGMARHARGGGTPGGSLFLPSVNNVSTNWANAGLALIGGIPTRSTQCGATLSPVGGVPSGAAGDDAHNIAAAIAACAAGDFVNLGAGASTAVNISLSGNVLTLNSGSLAIGEVIGCVGCQPGMTVTSGSGTTWGVSYGAAPGSTVSSTAATATVPYSVLQAEAGTILLNKGITLRGGGNCTANTTSPYCQAVINVYDGVLPDWSISSVINGSNCGVTTASHSNCSAGTAVILVSPNSNFDWGWAGCSIGRAVAPTGCGTTLSADVAQGATSITVASVASFAVGQWVLMDEAGALTSTVTPTGGTGGATIQAPTDFLSTSPSPATNRAANPDAAGGTTYAWSQYPNRVNAELHLITGIGAAQCAGGTATTICFDEPLTIAFHQSGGHSARVYWPTTQSSSTYKAFLNQAGVENLSMLRCANACVQEIFTAYSWVKNVETAMVIGSAVKLEWSARDLITGVYAHLVGDAENNGTEYLYAIDAASTGNLMENSISVFGGKCMVSRASGGGNVAANNYCDKTFYQQASIGSSWMDMGLNASHYAGSHHWLFEGNWADNCDGDETHGSGGYMTFFRNYCTGVRSTFVDPSNGKTANDAAGIGWQGGGTSATPTPLRAAGPMGLNYWYAYAGNVLGLIGTSTSGNGWTYQTLYVGGSGGGCTSVGATKSIWMSGWVAGEWPCADTNLKTAATQFLFKNGNYDTFDAAIVDNASGYSQSFPNSLYASAKPAYFSAGSNTYTWPWVTPQASPFVLANSGAGSGNPAKARYDAGTPFVQP